MWTRDIPREEWNAFLDSFTRQHWCEPVTLERSATADRARVEARAAPLIRVAHEPGAQRLAVTVRESPSDEVTHTVPEPEGVAIEEPAEADEDPQFALHLMGGGQRLVVRFRSTVH